MKKKVQVTIEIDTKTQELKILNGEFEVFSKKIHKVSASMRDLGVVSGGVFKALAKYDILRNTFISLAGAIKDNADAAIRYNASLETMRIGIASLIANQKRARGESISFYEALKESSAVMGMLKKANLETSATLKELTQGFQAALAPATAAGLSIKQTVEYTKLMTQAAGAMGVPMNQLAQELKSVVSGTIDLNSVVATNLGITNEQIKLHKKQGDLFEFLKKKLSSFADAGEAVQNSFDGIVSNLEDQWSEFLGLLSKPAFDEIKEGLKDLTSAVKEWTASLRKSRIEEEKWYQTKTIEEVKIKAKAVAKEMEELQRQLKENDGFLFFGLSDAERTQIEARIKKLNQELFLLGKRAAAIAENEEAMRKATETGKKADDTQKDLNKELQKHFDLLKSDDPYERLEEQYKKYLLEFRSYPKELVKIHEWYHKELAKLDMEAFRKKEEVYKEYLRSIGKESELFWMEEGEKINKFLLTGGITQEQALKMVQSDYAKFIKSIEQKSKKGSDSLKRKTKKTVEYVETTFDKATKNIYKSFDDNFFDMITGKFHDFKSFLRSLLDDILHGIVNPFARALSGEIAGGLGSFIGLPKISVASIASQLGLKDAGDKFVGMVNGTEVSISKTGEILSGGNALPSDAVNLLSTVKSGYTLATGSAAGGLYSIGNSLYTAGYTNSGMAFIGAGNWISGAGTSGLTTAGQIGYYGGGALIGAGMGYGIGTLGDMLFGVDTKAALYGAIGGALGGTILPMIFTSLTGPLGAFIGSVVGSVIGGLFGKWKTQEVGKQINALLTEGSIDSSAITDYAYNKKKNWFHTKKRWKDLGIDQEDLFAIRKLFAAYNETLERFGSDLEITLEKGRLKIDKKSNEFDEYIAKEFIKNLMGLDKSISKLKPIFEGHYKEFGGETLYLVERFAKSRMKWIDNAIAKAATQAEKDELIKAKEDLGRVKEVYEAWKAYAKKQEKSVSEAIVEAFADVLQTTRSHRLWLAKFTGKDDLSILKLKKQYAHEDLERVRKILGISDLDYKNFQKYYDEAIKSSPTPQTLQAWKAAKQAVEDAAEADKAYAEAKKKQIEEERKRYIELANYAKEQARRWDYLAKNVLATKLKQAADQASKAIESLSTKLSSLKGASSTLDNLIDRFTSKLESPREREAKFYSFLDLAKSALAAQNYADYNAYLQKASKYADFVEGKQYASSAEKRWEIARIANELKDLKSPTDLMIERLDHMIEQNRQIIDATQGSKESLYELVNVKIGGKTFEEITKDGLIQGIKSPDFTAIVGDNLDAISSELTGAGAYFQNIKLQDGKTMSLVDFDQDGRTDLTLAFDASGKLTGIQQNTKALLDLQVQELTRATKQLYAINAAPDYLKNYVATQYSADYNYVKTQQGQLEYTFITPLEETAVSLLKHLNSGQLNADLAATIRGEAYQIQSLAKILSDNGLGNKTVWLDSNHKNVSDLLDYYSYIDNLLKNRGFATGGYTGDYPTSAPVGVVHGQEFVFNAETTRNLGLNKDGGGVFVELLVEVKKLRGEVERLRSENAQLQAQIARNTEPIATAQRWER